MSEQGLTALQHEFWAHFYLPVIIWISIIVVLTGALVVKYPFGNWTKDNPNPYSGETLSLPRGYFRAVLTMTLLLVTIIFEMANLYSGAESEMNIYEWIMAFQMMVAFYFGSKVMHHITSADRSKSLEKSKSTDTGGFGSVSGSSHNNIYSSTTGGSTTGSSNMSSETTSTSSGGEFDDNESAG